MKDDTATSCQLNILLLCNKPESGQDAGTIVDHIGAFEQYSQHRIWLCSRLGGLPESLDLERFDVIIIHYSLSLLNNYYLSKQSKQRLRNCSALKVIFIQDEYRRIHQMIRELEYLKINVLYTCFPKQEIERIYPTALLPHVTKYPNLTGYVPERLLQIKTLPMTKDRLIHVGYRSRKLSYWFGELAYEKWNIVEQWFAHAKAPDLRLDVSYHEKDRIYGKDWIAFLSSCKTTLGVESGASVMDFTGALEEAVELYQLMHPQASFHEVQKKFLLEHEGRYCLNQISPRCFEAITLKTVLVLYEGAYSNILVPDRHYIMLKKDFSNIEYVLEKIRDDHFLQEMANRAYDEIALNPRYSYQYFIAGVDSAILQAVGARQQSLVTNPYQPTSFAKVLHVMSWKNKIRIYGFIYYQKLPPKLRLLIKSGLRSMTGLYAVLWRVLGKCRMGLFNRESL